jgi:hypothetical protein
MDMEHYLEDADMLGEKPVQMPNVSPQSVNELTCNRTRASGVVSHINLCRICGVTNDSTLGFLCIY